MGSMYDDPRVREALESMRKANKERAAFYREYGRVGMLERDRVKFIPKRASTWTKRELKNRINWLQGQRERLLHDGASAKDLDDNARKLARYTKELARRNSPAYRRYHRNERRRERYAIARRKAKRARMKELHRQYLEEKKAKRNMLKLLMQKKDENRRVKLA